jgi:hypothetical protein
MKIVTSRSSLIKETYNPVIPVSLAQCRDFVLYMQDRGSNLSHPTYPPYKWKLEIQATRLYDKKKKKKKTPIIRL